MADLLLRVMFRAYFRDIFGTFGSLLSVMELSSEKYVDFVEEHSWPSGLRED
jgi:hypothetical protein